MMEPTTWNAHFSDLEETYRAEFSSTKSTSILKELIQLSIDEDLRKSVTCSQTSILKNILTDTTRALHQPGSCDHVDKQTQYELLLLNCLKLLRNLCAGAPANQLEILKFLEPVCDLLSSKKEYGEPLLRTVAVQLLGNVCVGCEEGQQQVWSLCYPELLCTLLNGNNANCACMVLYTCILKSDKRRSELICGHNGRNLIVPILRCLVSVDQLEWSYLVMETLLLNTPLSQLYALIENNPCERLILFKLLADTCDDEDDTLLSGILSDQANLRYLQDQFVQHCTKYLSCDRGLRELLHRDGRLPEQQPEYTVQGMVFLLKILSETSCRMVYLQTLQQQSDLISLVKALEVLSDLSMMDGSLTSGKSRTHLRDYVDGSDKVKEHLLFGVKRNLIKLIGNLCYKSRRCQDKVRELEVIPLILNQCSLDMLNPCIHDTFASQNNRTKLSLNKLVDITQWSIWTIRNLCEENPDNQAVIAKLEQRGVANSDVLKEMGSEVVVGDDGRLKVRPTKQ